MSEPYALDEARLAPLLAAKLGRGRVWEADVFEAPAEVRDAEGAYRPLMTMLVERGTGFVFSARMFGRAYRAVDALGDDLLSVVGDRRQAPTTLVVKEDSLAAALAPLAARLAFAVEAGSLDDLYAARRKLAAPLGRSGGARRGPPRPPRRRG